MMSAPAVQIAVWMSAIASGCVSTSRSLLPLTSLAMVGEALAAIVGLVQLVALDHGAHGAVDDQDALVGGLLERGDAFARGSCVDRLLGCGGAAPVCSPSRWQMA